MVAIAKTNIAAGYFGSVDRPAACIFRRYTYTLVMPASRTPLGAGRAYALCLFPSRVTRLDKSESLTDDASDAAGLIYRIEITPDQLLASGRFVTLRRGRREEAQDGHR